MRIGNGNESVKCDFLLFGWSGKRKENRVDIIFNLTP